MLKIKKLDKQAIVPTKKYTTDAGWDIYSLYQTYIPAHTTAIISTGVAVEIPVGYVGLILERSSLATRGIHIHGGVIDAGYRDELRVIVYNSSEYNYTVNCGDRIAQLVCLPILLCEVEEVEELSFGDRGLKGFGSTGV